MLGVALQNKEVVLRSLFYSPNNLECYGYLALLLQPNESITLPNGIIMTKEDLLKKAEELKPKN
jgi:hypothetical protein